MRIIAEYGKISEKERYLMTAKSVNKVGFKNIVNETFKFRCAIIIEDEVARKKDDGSDDVKIKTILSIITDTGMLVAGDSKTTRDSFEELYENFGDSMFGDDSDISVVVQAAKSKSDRTFISLQLVME